jgi:hypothetical protein
VDPVNSSNTADHQIWCIKRRSKMQYSFLLALVIVLIIAWAAYDRVIYHGFAAVRLDDDSRKRKSGARAVAVLPPLHLGLHARVVRGLVSKAKADQIVWTPSEWSFFASDCSAKCE